MQYLFFGINDIQQSNCCISDASGEEWAQLGLIEAAAPWCEAVDNDAMKEQSCRVTLVCFDSSAKIPATYFSREMSSHLLRKTEVPLVSVGISKSCPTKLVTDV